MTDYNYIGKIPFVNYKCDKIGQIFSMNRNEERFFLAIPSVCRFQWGEMRRENKIFPMRFIFRKSGNTPQRRCLI